MAPVEIQLMVRKRDPEILWVRPGERVKIKHVKPVELEVYCREDDKSGVLRVDGPSQTVIVTKYLSNSRQNAIQLSSPQETFTGQESLQVSSPFYDEQVTVSHKPAAPGRSIGQITR